MGSALGLNDLLAELRTAETPVASTVPEPHGKPGGGLWGHPGLMAPPYIEHVAGRLIEQGHGESSAYLLPRSPDVTLVVRPEKGAQPRVDKIVPGDLIGGVEGDDRLPVARPLLGQCQSLSRMKIEAFRTR